MCHLEDFRPRYNPVSSHVGTVVSRVDGRKSCRELLCRHTAQNFSSETKNNVLKVYNGKIFSVLDIAIKANVQAYWIGLNDMAQTGTYMWDRGVNSPISVSFLKRKMMSLLIPYIISSYFIYFRLLLDIAQDKKKVLNSFISVLHRYNRQHPSYPSLLL